MQLDFISCPNVRDLGGYETMHGVTQLHRFVRAGGTRSLTQKDLVRFQEYRVSKVLDLRGAVESPSLTCRFSRQDWVDWHNVPLYDVDISSPAFAPAHDVDNYLVSSYFSMLASKRAIQEVFEFFGTATPNDCVLFHCAAGMDRTGMIAMLLLGLADVQREQILADYVYSFGSVEEVDAALAVTNALPDNTRNQTGNNNTRDSLANGFQSFLLRVRIEAITVVYDTLTHEYGSVRAFLESCNIDAPTLDAVRSHLLVP